MQGTVIFTITKETKGYSIKCSNNSNYNMTGIPGCHLFRIMEELADTFNNHHKKAILFEMG